MLVSLRAATTMRRPRTLNLEPDRKTADLAGTPPAGGRRALRRAFQPDQPGRVPGDRRLVSLRAARADDGRRLSAGSGVDRARARPRPAGGAVRDRAPRAPRPPRDERRRRHASL